MFDTVALSLERDSVTRFFSSAFCHQSSSPKPLKISIAPYRKNFDKSVGDIRKSRFTTGVNDTGVNLELRIASQIFEKIEMALLFFKGLGGKLIHEKKHEAKNLMAPFFVPGSIPNCSDLSFFIKLFQDSMYSPTVFRSM
jgi:hypothetical protein